MTRLHWIVVAVLLTGLPLWAAEERVVFEDRFDRKLGEGWSWLRENPPAWKIADGALEIRVEPGDAQSVKNALVRNAPDRRKGKTAIEVTVTFNTPPTNQYEQAGITWYRGNQPVFKLVHERVDGKLYIVPGKVPAEMKTVTLRLIVTADKYTAQFRPDAKGEFKTVAEGDLAAGADEKVSLQCYQGPPDAEHWIRFDDFRVVQLAEGAAEAEEGFKSLFDDKTLVAWVSPADLTQRGGKLVLDGSGYLWAAKNANLLVTDEEEPVPFDATVQTMFYKARSKQTGNMWDTWLYLHEGIYYLYYLAKYRDPWDNVSMATSPDGVHWKEIGRLLSKGRGVTWMGTGSTWKSPNFEKDGKFFMNFSEWKEPRQTIFSAESKDLIRWTRLGREYEFVQDERWYEKNGRWDCIWTIPRPGGGLYGYWTATPKSATGGRFGFGETLDGVTWKALEPPKVEGAGEGEVGAIERIGQRYYMMFGTGGLMVTLVADSPQGPFKAAKTNYRLLAGHTYFSRFFPAPDGVLVNHHSIARNGQVYFGTLKSTALDEEGTLRLAWWKGNEKMKAEPLEVRPPAAGVGNDARIAMLRTPLDVDKGVILEGTLALPETQDQPRRGLYMECGKDSGAAILVNAAGAAELGMIRADGSDFKAEKGVDREMAFGKPAKFRLLLKQSLLEFYLDDILIECFSLPQNATGRMGFIGTDAVRQLSAWQCAP